MASDKQLLQFVPQCDQHRARVGKNLRASQSSAEQRGGLHKLIRKLQVDGRHGAAHCKSFFDGISLPCRSVIE